MDLMTIYDRLAGLHDDAAGFEAERLRVLQEDFDRAPADRRREWFELQNELNLLRNTLPPEQFRGALFRRMTENIENIADLVQSMHSTLQPRASANRAATR
jgi:hypothetical protein